MSNSPKPKLLQSQVPAQLHIPLKGMRLRKGLGNLEQTPSSTSKRRREVDDKSKFHALQLECTLNSNDSLVHDGHFSNGTNRSHMKKKLKYQSGVSGFSSKKKQYSSPKKNASLHQSSKGFDRTKKSFYEDDSMEIEETSPERRAELKYQESIYKDTQKILDRGITLPNTGKGRVDREQLRVHLARSNCEMANNVKSGTYPVFGYPLLCYSPPNGGKIFPISLTQFNLKPNEHQSLWQLMYHSAMKVRAAGQPNEISELLSGYDDFLLQQETLLKQFTKGKIRKNKSTMLQNSLEESDFSPQYADFYRETIINRRAKERPEEATPITVAEKKIPVNYKSDMKKMLREMRKSQIELEEEERKELVKLKTQWREESTLVKQKSAVHSYGMPFSSFKSEQASSRSLSRKRTQQVSFPHSEESRLSHGSSKRRSSNPHVQDTFNKPSNFRMQAGVHMFKQSEHIYQDNGTRKEEPMSSATFSKAAGFQQPALELSNYKTIAEEEELTKNILSHRSHNSNLHYSTDEKTKLQKMEGPRAASQEHALGRSSANPDTRANPKFQQFRPTLNISELNGRPYQEQLIMNRSMKLQNDPGKRQARNEHEFNSIANTSQHGISSSQSQKLQFKSRDSATNLTWQKGAKAKCGESSAKNSTQMTGTKGMTYTSGHSHTSATKGHHSMVYASIDLGGNKMSQNSNSQFNQSTAADDSKRQKMKKKFERIFKRSSHVSSNRSSQQKLKATNKLVVGEVKRVGRAKYKACNIDSIISQTNPYDEHASNAQPSLVNTTHDTSIIQPPMKNSHFTSTQSQDYFQKANQTMSLNQYGLGTEDPKDSSSMGGAMGEFITRSTDQPYAANSLMRDHFRSGTTMKKVRMVKKNRLRINSQGSSSQKAVSTYLTQVQTDALSLKKQKALDLVQKLQVNLLFKPVKNQSPRRKKIISTGGHTSQKTSARRLDADEQFWRSQKQSLRGSLQGLESQGKPKLLKNLDSSGQSLGKLSDDRFLQCLMKQNLSKGEVKRVKTGNSILFRGPKIIQDRSQGGGLMEREQVHEAYGDQRSRESVSLPEIKRD